MQYAPVIIITLNRYDHLYNCLESLEKCTDAEKTDVYVALDYPPSEKYVDGWKKNDIYLKEKESKHGFKSLTVYRRETNYMLYGPGNGKTAIKDATEGKDRFIYTEDDIIFSKNFLVYMNTCLEKYKDDDDVIAVCGYSYPVEWKVSPNSTCFKQQINMAAWGTGYWTNKYFSTVKNLKDGVNLSNCEGIIAEKKYKKMIDACLREYITALCDRFSHYRKIMRQSTDIAIRTYLVVNNKYAITPVISKTRNNGFDGSGMYCQNTSDKKAIGKTASSYNYLEQPIDSADSFELIPDTLYDYEDNRKRLNEFDYRTPQQMARTHRLIWLIEHIGISAARFYSLLCVPYDYAPKILTRLKKKINSINGN